MSSDIMITQLITFHFVYYYMTASLPILSCFIAVGCQEQTVMKPIKLLICIQRHAFISTLTGYFGLIVPGKFDLSQH